MAVVNKATHLQTLPNGTVIDETVEKNDDGTYNCKTVKNGVTVRDQKNVAKNDAAPELLAKDLK